MKSYKSFRFSGYSWNHHAGKVSLRYSLDGEVDFEETLLLPEPISNSHLKAHEWQLERLLFALHLAGGISYFKTCLPKTIGIYSGALTRSEATFWNTVYERGLGEFFFRNNIEFRGLINFPTDTEKEKDSKIKSMKVKSLSAGIRQRAANEQRVLVPIGGGKDSLVTAELLKRAGAHVTLFRLGHHPIIDELANIAGLPLITAKRTISGNLFDLNAQGALNGHVPITAYVSILSLLIAELYGFDAVVMSNERSANVGNVQYKGMEINHQWSKSVEFEKALRKYLSDTIFTDTQYFSLLRPLSELKIGEIFCRYPAYFSTATSCNKNWKLRSDHHEHEKVGNWCGECPKCAFVFAVLAAHLDVPALKRIFGKILFDDPALIPLFKELLGIQHFKPFECVGTPEETKVAFLLAMKNTDFKKSPVMKMFETEVLPSIKHPESLIEQCLRPNKDHCIPSEFQSLVL